MLILKVTLRTFARWALTYVFHVRIMADVTTLEKYISKTTHLVYIFRNQLKYYKSLNLERFTSCHEKEYLQSVLKDLRKRGTVIF